MPQKFCAILPNSLFHIKMLQSIQPLLKLSVLALSININGKSPDILRPMFGISNNLDDPEQKARVMKENEWAIEARRQFDEDQKTKII
jgi:hypothetical protein